ncbi:MAG: hypothetical protein A3F09_05005 [Chlamydiae bacterium RIFCSPHIGHO2_12_FULL_49_11]|nr:MAG: hypothetical protein A3F09_05005 [Chlamydiae bacterium RIFCSPHIGHO2_12_FULL_49_11]
MEYLKQIKEHVETLELSKVVVLWQEYCLSDEIDPLELKKILQAIHDSGLKESFGVYVEEILPLWDSLPNSLLKEEIFQLIVDLQTTNSESLRHVVIEYLTSVFSTNPDFTTQMRLIGIKDNPNFQGAVTHFKILTHMKPGNFFLHTGGWGVGEVMDVSYLREEAIMEFDYVAGQKDVSFANAFNTLQPISSDHFLARRFGNADAFEEFARKSPCELICVLLRDLGPSTSFEIKEELCNLVIPEEEWTRWWQNARTRLKKHPLIQNPATSKDPFRLLIEEVLPEDRLIEKLKNSPQAGELIDLFYAFMRDFPVALKKDGFKQFLAEQLKEFLKNHELSDAEEIQILFLLEDLGEKHPESFKKLLQHVKIDEVINRFQIISLKKRLLNLAKEFRPDWKENFAEILRISPQSLVKDTVFEALIKEDRNFFVATLKKIIDVPMQSCHTIMWYLPKALEDPDLPFGDPAGNIELLQSFFNTMYLIENLSDQKELLKKMHNFLTQKRFEHIRKIFEHAVFSDLQEILLLASKCHSLSDHEMKILHSLAEVIDPSIKSLRKKEHEEVEDHVIWTTHEGYEKIKERIHTIATVEVPENAREVEAARSLGDLRENSEYKFAKEKRSRLQGELRFLSKQFSQMRSLTDHDIDTNKISVGTTATLLSNGEAVEYTLLGPWDSDPEKNILSFQSELAKKLLNLRVGAHVELHGKMWEVKKIESYLKKAKNAL